MVRYVGQRAVRLCPRFGRCSLKRHVVGFGNLLKSGLLLLRSTKAERGRSLEKRPNSRGSIAPLGPDHHFVRLDLSPDLLGKLQFRSVLGPKLSPRLIQSADLVLPFLGETPESRFVLSPKPRWDAL